jgi:hypothetical protein
MNQLTYVGQYNQHQVDSLLSAAGIPGGIFIPVYQVKLYKVIYNTVSYDSTPTTASGLLAVPIGAPCKTGIISYQHAEITQTNQAPSNFKNEWFISLVAASAGYVALCPDYLGLGIAAHGFHPFLHAQSEATAVIDLIRAAKEVVDSIGAPVNDQLLLVGYSEGGHATLAAHQMIQEKLDSVMHVTASAPLSGPYDLGGTMADVLTSDSVYPDPYYLPYLFLGYNTAYQLFSNDSDMMVYPYDSTMPKLFNGRNSPFTIDDDMPSVPSHIMQPVQLDSMINDSTTNFFRQRMRQNDVYNWNPTSPVRMIYCIGDATVPPQNSLVAYNNFVQNGSTNVFTSVADSNATHDVCTDFATLIAYNWLLTFAYKPLTTDSFTIVNSTSVDTPNGSITVYTGGGEAPYSYAWSNGDSTATIGGLSDGTYYFTVTDKNLCTNSDSTKVQLITTGMEDQLLTHINIYPNPSKGVVHVRNLEPSDALKSIEAYDMQGNLAPTHVTNQGSVTQLYFDAAAQGVYTLRLQSASGKELISKIVILPN